MWEYLAQNMKAEVSFCRNPVADIWKRVDFSNRRVESQLGKSFKVFVLKLRSIITIIGNMLSVSIQKKNRIVFLSSNYRLIVVPQKFDVLKTNICPRSEASRENMLVLEISNLQGATIRPIISWHKQCIVTVLIVHH